MSCAGMVPALDAASLAPSLRVLVMGGDSSANRWLFRLLADEHEVSIDSSGEDAVRRAGAASRSDLIVSDLAAPTSRKLLERLAPGLVHQFVFVTRDETTGKVHALLARAPGRHIDVPFDVEPMRRTLLEGLGRGLRDDRAQDRAIRVRDVIAREAARRVPEAEALELANTAAQHLILGLDCSSAIANIVQHRIRHGWLKIAEGEGPAFCRELADAVELLGR